MDSPNGTVLQIPGATAEAIGIERGLLGAMLLDRRGPTAWPTLVPEHFFLHYHQLVYQALLDLLEVTEHPDLPLLAHELRRQEKLDEVGGPAFLAGLVEDGMLVFDLQRYGAMIRQAATERQRLHLAAGLLKHPEGSDYIDAILRALEDQPGYAEAPAAILHRLATGPLGAPIELGLGDLDIRMGQVTVLGGRTSHGKTALAVECALRFAEAGRPVAFVTLEDTAEAIMARMVANRAGKSQFYVRMSRLAGLDATRRHIEDLPLRVVSVPGNREGAVLGAVAACSEQVVVLDHLQHIEAEIDDELKRHLQIDRIMGRLVSIARRGEQKAILVSAQLNREMEKLKREPQSADLRDSGAIEQKARQIWLVYWRYKHDTKVDPADVLVKLDKNTEGATRRIALKWDPRSGRYFNPGDLVPEDQRSW